MQRVSSADLDHVLDRTRDLWEELRGKRIFITGGTGFFGRWLLETFTWANDRLGLGASATILTRSPIVFEATAPHLANHPAIELLMGNIRNFDFPNKEIQYIIHAAIDSSVPISQDQGRNFFDTTTVGTRRVCLLAQFRQVEKMLLTSSGAVYGRQPNGITHIPEEYEGGPDPLDIRSAYGEGKRIQEQICSQFTYDSDVQIRIARCFAFVGPYLPLRSNLATRMSTGYAIGNFIGDGIAGGPILVNGDGTSYRSYLYGADLAIWLWTILFRGESIRPYNVGSENGLTIKDLAHTVAQSFDPAIEVRIAQTPVPGRPIERYIPSTERAREELGLKQTIGLEDAIKRTISWNIKDNA